MERGSLIAGVDEVGIGPLAGPVVSAAVILAPDITRRRGLWRQVRDCKLLKEAKRRELAGFIRAHALDFGIGLCDHREIDKLNILQASLESMRRAVLQLRKRPRELVIDGRNTIRGLRIKQQAIVDGDQKILAIAAASVIAKVYRDDLMIKFAKQFPQYGFEVHKGYGTRLHRERLKKFGPCPIHRRSFGPVRMAVVAPFMEPVQPDKSGNYRRRSKHDKIHM